MSFKALLIGIVVSSVIFYASYKASTRRPTFNRVAADQAKVNISISPGTGTVGPGPQTLHVIIQPAEAGNTISGIRLTLNAAGTLKILDVSNPESYPEGDSGIFSQITKEVSHDRARLSYVITLPDDKLPKAVKLALRVEGFASGAGSLAVDPATLQIVGKIPGYTYANSIIESAQLIFTGNETEQAGKSLTLKVRLQGVAGDPFNRNKSVNVKAALTNPQTGYEYAYQIPVIAAGAGVWSGNAPIDAPTGEGYTLRLKGAHHLQKKIDGTFSITDNENIIDLSAVTLLAGDIQGQNNEQDGVIDALDIAFIRNNFGKSDAGALEKADLNFDGTVDSQDYSLLISSLSQRVDEN